MKKIDILLAFIIGEVSALLALVVLKNIQFTLDIWILPIILPILSIIGLWITYFLGKKFLIIWQAAKFILVGILNTFVDLGVLNLLIFISGISGGWGYSAFKGISFTIAVINSYFWNKFWTFRKPKTVTPGKEFLQFFIVSAMGFGINVGIASLVVNLIGPHFEFSGISQTLWANIGAVVATFVAMAWNFIGYKLFVFK